MYDFKKALADNLKKKKQKEKEQKEHNDKILKQYQIKKKKK